MVVLYFSLDDFDSLTSYRSINTDLLREFQKHGHRIVVVSPSERKKKLPTRMLCEDGSIILKPRIGNIQKTNIIEKGISTITIGSIIKSAIKKNLKNMRFDLILYCTPPITFLSAIQFVKERDGARTYLLLKDIFPQNAVDLGLLKKTGVKGILYKYFRGQEKRLYRISDHIGCMSQANVDYIVKHNPEINPEKVEVCPNSIEVIDKSVDDRTRKSIREKCGIPLNKKVFVYGGNLGKPQGIPFLIECLKECRNIEDVFFLIVGDGTEYYLIKEYVESARPLNVKLMKRLPKEDYDTMVGACDVGMIFLDHRFTIPNFPSRLLSYMAAKLPVLAVTDSNTDIGKVIVEGGFGWWCESDKTTCFASLVKRIYRTDFEGIRDREFSYLINHFSVEKAYRIVEEKITVFT